MINIVLIGMPGCGKSTIGRILAANSGRLFVDCDNVLVEAAGFSIPEIFAREGEEGFRFRETQTLKEISGQLTAGNLGLVIATGGGCVTREENYSLLKRIGVIVFIERDISSLAREGRPLSTGDLEEMYRQRFPLYKRFADYSVKNDAAADIVAKNILEAVFATGKGESNNDSPQIPVLRAAFN